MLKKLIIASTILAASSSFALPFSYTKGDPYVGFGAGIQNIHGYNGLYGNVFGGLNILVGCRRNIYLGGEVFADSGSIPISQKRFNRTTYGFGASLMPGVLIFPTTLAYMRAGISTFRYNKTNDYSPGGQLGLGLQTQLSSCWDIRGEYVYTGKGVITGFGTSRFNFFDIGFVYKF